MLFIYHSSPQSAKASQRTIFLTETGIFIDLC